MSSAIRILQNERVAKQLFPHRVCPVHNWFPLVVTPFNMRKVALENNVVMTTAPGSAIVALSYGDTRPLSRKTAYTLYSCGDPKQKRILSHIRIHLRKFQMSRNLMLEGHLIVNLLGHNTETGDIKNNILSKSGACLKDIDSFKVCVLMTDVHKYTSHYEHQSKL